MEGLTWLGTDSTVELLRSLATKEGPIMDLLRDTPPRVVHAKKLAADAILKIPQSNHGEPITVPLCLIRINSDLCKVSSPARTQFMADAKQRIDAVSKVFGSRAYVIVISEESTHSRAVMIFSALRFHTHSVEHTRRPNLVSISEKSTHSTHP